ncbi:NAD-dependent epimerase/dehydratase family protein [Herbaspirillum sp. RTI4]|uniref:NAD-dependent epimerase/dehydratase family protein n=1 Tax=Herbaspirillum sp. RTI4 TaxID=3048640 RepID=UPI002AB3E991|nr:NAD-dependent epimerase/dehydratase family protein [Herbaspirillum sp. RTI4]MDY7579036.1 NAD-dependent epimerase/dehydratase family protein [Herbaspirillum sp. RTI4]MEA9982379.1 NAD-dependent epimerase/dehydratase family protein [Herbaspirillum sp. RTI4]
MNVLVLGATGLIGSHLVTALENAGCSVVGASRRAVADRKNHHQIDFSKMTTEQAWLPLLDDVDAVVNCVGIIREARSGDFDLLHRAAPVALFAACESRGIQRVIQVSALGSGVDASTEYWRSKGAAEHDLLQRPLSATIVRPSLVYGEDGPGSQLFLAFSTLPFLMMPMANDAMVQPIHVDDLVAALVKLVFMKQSVPREMAVVGPVALSMGNYLAALRHGLQAPPAIVLPLPTPIAKIVARVAAIIPSSALTPDSLQMLIQSADGSNTADAGPVTALLGRPLQAPASFAHREQRTGIVFSWGSPILRAAFALFWLLNAISTWVSGAYPSNLSTSWFGEIVLVAVIAQAATGLALLFYYRSWIWPVQIILIVGGALLMNLLLQQWGLDSMASLIKNIPLLAVIAIMWRAEGKPD